MAFALAPVTAADATFSAAGAAAWAAGFVPSGATTGGIPWCTSATAWTTTSGLTFNANGTAGEGLAIAADLAMLHQQVEQVEGELRIPMRTHERPRYHQRDDQGGCIGCPHATP